MWIVINVGCIECGVSSAIVGRFSTEREAKDIADKLDKDGAAGWRQGGQNHYQAFEEPEPNTIAKEYLKYLEGISGGQKSAG